MTNILVISYSQTGQLTRIKDAILEPVKANPAVNVEHLYVEPAKPFPFPWPFVRFFRIFPETVAMQPIPLLPNHPQKDTYDLVILCYQVWFLSPSLPISSFLQTEQARQVLSGTPVVTVIGCRGMWLMAQEKVKKLLDKLGARLVDNVVLSDDCGAFFSFLATPLWMFTGNKKPLSWVPKAGVSEQDIAGAGRFGKAIVNHLSSTVRPLPTGMLKGLNAVKINEKMIASERVGNHSFTIWSRLLRKLGGQDSRARGVGLFIYVCFLLCLILTVVPISALLKKLIAPLTKHKIAEQKRYYAQPSGE